MCIVVVVVFDLIFHLLEWVNDAPTAGQDVYLAEASHKRMTFFDFCISDVVSGDKASSKSCAASCKIRPVRHSAPISSVLGLTMLMGIS